VNVRRLRIPGTKVRPPSPHRRVCLLIGGEDDPVVAVRHDGRKSVPRDSGFTLFTASAPPGRVTDDDLAVYCLHCLSKRHPEAERGLLLAHAYGFAYWDEDDGEWVAENEDGHEVVFDSGDEPLDEEDER
jgi:hypothetical protein